MPTTLVSGTLNLTGTDLDSASCDVVLTNVDNSSDVYILTASTCTSTNVEAAVNSGTNLVKTGKYWVQVKTNSGYTNRKSLNVTFNLGTAVSGSSQAGAYLSLTGAIGWPSDLNDKRLNVTLKTAAKTYILDVVSCCIGGNAIFRVPATTASS